MAEFAFHHGGVSVPDLEAAIAWYARILGFEEETRFYIEREKAQTVMIRKGPLRFELFEVTGAAPLPEGRRSVSGDLKVHGNKHLGFRIADLDVFLAEMREKGVEIVLEVRKDFGSGCFIHDCFGNLIEFVEEPNDG